MAKALGSGNLAGAALDLCGTEPVKDDDPVFAAPNTVLTPHIAWQTVEPTSAPQTLVVDNILAYFASTPGQLGEPGRDRVPLASNNELLSSKLPGSSLWPEDKRAKREETL